MFWSLGNEFGFGHMEGDNSPAGYSRLARENALKMLEKSPNLTFCSSGPYPNEDWIAYCAKPLSDLSRLVSIHSYAKVSPDGPFGSEAFMRQSYETCLSGVQYARNKIRTMRDLLGNDSIKISFDEWNVWYGWYRPSAVMDGIYTGMMMTMFISQAQNYGVDVACHFEAVNEGAIKVTPTAASLTAAGQALSVMQLHCGGVLRYADDCVIATEKEGKVTITLVNPLYDRPKKYFLDCDQEILAGTLYHGKNLLPHHCFDVEELSACRQEGRYAIEIPPHSIAMVQYYL